MDNPSWWPTAPEYRVFRNGLPTGSDRNLPCKCGSGMKAKRCTVCGVVIIPTEPPMSEMAYIEEIRKILGVSGQAGSLDFRRVYHYYQTRAISPQQAAEFLIAAATIERAQREAQEEAEAKTNIKPPRGPGNMALLTAGLLSMGSLGMVGGRNNGRNNTR